MVEELSLYTKRLKFLLNKACVYDNRMTYAPSSASAHSSLWDTTASTRRLCQFSAASTFGEKFGEAPEMA